MEYISLMSVLMLLFFCIKLKNTLIKLKNCLSSNFSVLFSGSCIFLLVCILDGQPLLASGGSSGVISIWNLEKKRLQSVVREAHDSVITSLHFFANEPVLMSSSADNSIKVRIILKVHTCIHVIKFFEEPYMLGEYSFCLVVDELKILMISISIMEGTLLYS